MRKPSIILNSLSLQSEDKDAGTDDMNDMTCPTQDRFNTLSDSFIHQFHAKIAKIVMTYLVMKLLENR